MKTVKVIKTLPHLFEIFLKAQENIFYSKKYSDRILSFLETIVSYSIQELDYFKIKKFLDEKNYQKVDFINTQGEFSQKGDLIQIWFRYYPYPIKIEFEFDQIYKVELLSDKQNKKIPQPFILLNTIELTEDEYTNIKFSDFTKPLSSEMIIFTYYIDESLANYKNLLVSDFTYPQLYYSNLNLLTEDLKRYRDRKFKIILKSNSIDQIHQIKKIKEFLSKSSQQDSFILENLKKIDLPAGFISESEKILCLTDREIFGTLSISRKNTKPQKQRVNIDKLLNKLQGDIEIDDFIVHEDYGIGIYRGITQQNVDNETLEYILIEYDQNDKLYIPLDQIQKITKYIGPEGVHPKITRLGKNYWEKIKNNAKKTISITARELIDHYAKIQISKANRIPSLENSELYNQFTNKFPYLETNDQIRSIEEVLKDLDSDKPMNRLLVGDVGFGKTEVFARAAFKVVENGGQVAILAPTTVLVAQHFKVFIERFRGFPVSIGFISRFNSKKKNSEIIQEVSKGKIDIIVGTHKLLSSEIKFKNLNLLVIDEEQRFGVKQKEKIKELNYGVHVLSVSATPIPRTLGMALSSIQDLSIITEPPVNRKPIKTFLFKFSEEKITDVIKKEIERNGQCFFVHNEISSIYALEEKLKKLIPNIEFRVAHGQMASSKLEKIMLDFYLNKVQCLICTTIIENGIDLPNVNTIIINKAQNFGLGQLYQLRGRVGRSEKEAFCYLFYDGKNIFSEENKSKNLIKKRKLNYLERLQSMIDNQDLGAGFRIASRDLEIRGAGNLLGESQSGHMFAIGYALFMEILAEEINKMVKAN